MTNRIWRPQIYHVLPMAELLKWPEYTTLKEARVARDVAVTGTLGEVVAVIVQLDSTAMIIKTRETRG